MANDNTLGAPTEGLGQTVTFAVGGAGGGPRMSAPQRQAIRNNPGVSQAIMNSRAQHVPDREADRTFEILAKLGGEILKPKLEAQRTEQYVKGMQAAAQGQAVTEIVDEQPWYSKIFGPTAMVDGARAYSASAKVASAAVDIEANMLELRKMSPAEFSKYAADRITSSRTGDPTTDMMVMQQLSQQLPSVLKSQAKNHLIYQNEQLVESIGSNADAMMAKLGQLDAKARTNTGPQVGPIPKGQATDEGDVLGAQIELSATMSQVPVGMDKTVHEKIMAQSIAKSLIGGNFAAFNTLKDSGQLDKMNPSISAQLQQVHRSATYQAQMGLPPEFVVKRSDFMSIGRNPEATPEDVLAAARGLNEDYTRMTGDRSPYITSAATTQELVQLRASQDAEQHRLAVRTATARTKAEKDQAELAETAFIANRVVTPASGKGPYLMAAEKPAEQQKVFDHIRTSANPALYSKVLIEQADVATDQTYKSVVEAGIGTAKTAGDPTMLYNVYAQHYLPLVRAAGDNNEAVAQKYAGRYGEDMAHYHRLAQGRDVPPVEQAVLYNEVVSPKAKPLVITKKNSEVVSALTTGFIMSHMPFTSEPIRDPEGYAAELVPVMKPYLSTESAIKDAKLALPNLNLYGGYHWKKNTTSTDLLGWIAKNKVVGGAAPDNIDEALTATVRALSEDAGIDNPTVGQTRDAANGEPQLYIMGSGPDGKPRIRPFMASELHASLLREKAADETAFKYGSKITYQPAPNAPSIYAPAAEWEEYRKSQRPKQE